MKAFFAAAGFVAGASAAVVARGDQCCFQLTASGGASGSVGQYTDGQNRIGGGYPPASYCIDNGKITDKSGRGCVISGPTNQIQCDTNATPAGGFSISSSGELEHAGSTTFWACPYQQGAYNIYTSPVPGQDKCVQISLSTGGTCAVSSSHSTWVSPPTTKPMPMPSGHTSKMAPPPPPPESKPPMPMPPPANTCPPCPPSQTVTVWKQSTGETCPPAPVQTVTVTAPGAPAPPPQTVWSTTTVTVKEECSSSPMVMPPPTQTPPSMPPPMQSPPSMPPPMQSPPNMPPPMQSPPNMPPPMQSPPNMPPPMQSPPNMPPPMQSSPNMPPPMQSPPPQTTPHVIPPPPPKTSVAPPPPPVWHNSSMPATKPAPPPTSTKPTPPASTCPGELTGAYQTPHLIVPIKSSSPDQAYGTQYTATISETECSIFNFDIPASYSGMTCELGFLLPEQKQLETSSFTLSGSGSLNFWSLKSPADQSTTWNTCPSKSSQLGSWSPMPGSKYSPWSGSCAAGTTVSIEVCATESLSFTFFEDWNPCPIGLFMTAW